MCYLLEVRMGHEDLEVLFENHGMTEQDALRPWTRWLCPKDFGRWDLDLELYPCRRCLTDSDDSSL